VKRLALVVFCVLVGLAAGGVWTLLQDDRYRADARVLVRPASARIVPAVEALAESSLVGTNVAQTLHLSSAPEISAERGDSGVLTVSTQAGARERARQIDAEAVVILMQKVRQRFATVGATATVLDPAHVAEQTSPTPGRNLLITGLAGLVVGLAAAAATSVRRSPAVDAPAPADVDPRVERRLQARIDRVTQRERTLAQRAGQLAAREQDLARREAERAAPPPPVVPEPQPPAPPPSAPKAEVAAPAVAPASSRWNLNELEELVSGRSAVSAETAEEWQNYLQLLRSHAAVDGALPSGFDGLLNDIFADLAPLLSRESSAET
jgi:capsular polysaccharide biosynthesis protein